MSRRVERWLGVALGTAVGVMVGFFCRGGWTADWVGAIGTWVGSIATVAAIVWAVHTFQLDRQHQRDDEQEARQEARQALLREAHRVSVTITGGGGIGGGDPWNMTSVNLRVMNNTEHVVKLLGQVIEDEADFALRVHSNKGNGYELMPHEEWLQLIGLDPPWPAHDNEVSGRPLRPGRRAILTYRFDGRTWECATDGEPRQVIM